LKIENINDEKLDEELFNYLLNDLQFALDNFQRKMTELDFINYLWDYFYKKDNDINLKILDYFENKETHLF
jgi:hypothetical protein